MRDIMPTQILETTFRGRPVTAKSKKSLCMKLFLKGFRPDCPDNTFVINDFDTGELLTTIRYDAEKDIWYAKGVKTTIVSEKFRKEVIINMEKSVMTVIVPEQVLDDGKIVPEHEVTTVVPAHKTNVLIPAESKKYATEECWTAIPSTKGLFEKTCC